MRTTAGLLTQDGTTIFAAGAKANLSRVQQEVASDLGGLIGKDATGLHAEVKALSAADSMGLKPSAIVASRPICEACQNYISLQGGTLINETTAIW